MPTRIGFLLLAMIGTAAAFEQLPGSKRPWQQWPLISTVSVTIENGTTAKENDLVIRAYLDPENPADVLLYPTCWLIRREEKQLSQAGCGDAWRIVGGRLMFDHTYRGEKGSRLQGVAWDDFKRDLSFFSFLFRRPRFTVDRVEFYDEERWFTVSGLPPIAAEPSIVEDAHKDLRR